MNISFFGAPVEYEGGPYDGEPAQLSPYSNMARIVIGKHVYRGEHDGVMWHLVYQGEEA